VYNRIVQGKDLLADVLPPPEFIVESHLTANRIKDGQRWRTCCAGAATAGAAQGIQ
jgi:hypothetical protein